MGYGHGISLILALLIFEINPFRMRIIFKMNYFDSEVINFDCFRFWCSLASFRVRQTLFGRYKSEITFEFRDSELNTVQVLSTSHIAHCTLHIKSFICQGINYGISKDYRRICSNKQLH